MNNFNKRLNHGLTLVEVLIATSIILVFLVSLLGVHTLYLKTAFTNGNVVKGAYLVEESVEAVRFLRDSSWSANIAPLSLNVNYGLVFDAGTWQATTTNIRVDNIFERVMAFSAVYRDASGDIVSSGGTLDPDILLVISSVSWANGGVITTKSISTYITNIFDN